MPPVYVDHAATTPIRPEVLEAMLPHLRGDFGNPSSNHRWGRRARAALDGARATLASAIGAAPREIVFTRGGTEANNLALAGRAAVAGPGASIVVSRIEHKAVLETAERLPGPVVRIPVREGSGLDLDELRRAVTQKPAVVSIMWVNNETGDVLPIAEAAGLARAGGAAFHTDAVQAVGKIPVRVDRTPVDLLTLTGHKLGGPRGAGALFVRRGTELEPILHGGGQEWGLRPGTEDVASAVGLATAVTLAVEAQEAKARAWTELCERLLAGLQELVPQLVRHGIGGAKAPHVLNVGLPGWPGDALLAALDLEGVAASGGSACQSGTGGRSYVLEEIHGPGPAPARFSFGWSSRPEDVDAVLEAVGRVVARRASGPPIPA